MLRRDAVERQVSRRLRRLALTLAALGALAAATLALAFAWRLTLAERWLLAQLAQRGATPASLQVTRLDAHGLELMSLALGPEGAPDLAIDRLELAWTLHGLRAPRLDALRLDGLRLQGAQGREPSFGAAQALWRGVGDASGGAQRGAALPVRALELRGASLRFDTPQGLLTGELDGVLAVEPDGRLGGQLEIALSHPQALLEGTVAPAGTLDAPSARIDLTLASIDARLHVDGTLGVDASRALAGELELALSHAQGQAQGSVALAGTLDAPSAKLDLKLHDARNPARLAPARLRGELAGGPRALRFDLALEAADGRARLEARGEADAVARSGRAQLRVAPLDFAPAFQPGAVLPGFGAWLSRSHVRALHGRLAAQGQLELTNGAPTLRVALDGSDLGLATRSLQVAGVTGALALQAPPWRTPPGQRLQVGRLDVGVPLTAGLLQLQLRSPDELVIERARFGFAGGELRTQDFPWTFDTPRGEARLEASGLELAELVRLLSLDGVDGSGRLDGLLPLVRRQDGVHVAGGLLRARPEGGTIRYRPSAAVADFAASRPDDLGIAIAALSDFHYDWLELRIEGELAGELRAELHLRGANPGYRDGHPVEFNLALDAKVADLVRSGQSAGVPRWIEEHLREITEREKP